jgi:hypothetical protein
MTRTIIDIRNIIAIGIINLIIPNNMLKISTIIVYSLSNFITTISGGQLKRIGKMLVPTPVVTIIFLPSSSI